MDLGGLWRNVEEHGEVWWNVLERVGQMWTMHEIINIIYYIYLYSLCTYLYKFIVYFFHMVVYWKTGLIQVNQLGVKRLTNPSQQLSCDSIQTWKIAIIV